MIGIIFISILLSLIWGAVLGFGLPLPIALLPTIVALVATVAVVVLRRVQSRKSAREIENVLKAQGAAQAESVRPDQKPEVEAMQAEFGKAVASLKSSKLGKGGASALAVLPWYLLIGPPGGGKSTALRNSGLQFRFLSSRGGGVRGVGGTRNCEWWLTNDAIILDTAGRYTTEDDDRDEWFSFLDTLRKSRPKKPVNGLMVAISVGELCGTPEEAAARGKLLRERVDEVMARLRMSVPVYVVFTKMDLIAGFVETFGHLPKSERGQVWGFTEPVAGREEAPEAIFGRHFAELAKLLSGLSLSRLAQERRVDARERIFQFPQQFANLEENLTEFVAELFVEDAYQETPLMRGVYFTSGTQEGRPIDRVMNAMAQAFGMKQELPQASAPSEAKSYFLRELFSEVVFRDQNLATRSAKESRRQSMLTYAYAGGAFGLAALVCLLPTLAFFENRALVRQTRENAAAVRKELEAGGAIAPALRKLDPLREQLVLLDGWSENGSPWSMGFGMYVGDEVFTAARAFYADAVKQVLVKPAFDAEARALRSFAEVEERTRSATGPELVGAMQRLKLYLLLSAPRAETEPALTAPLRAWMERELADRWSERPGVAGKEDLTALVAAHAALYPTLLEKDPALLLKRDEALVKSVRSALGRLSLSRLALEQLVATPGLEDYGLSVAGVVGGSAVYLQGNRTVRGAFTRRGFEERVSEILDGSQGESDAWVVGQVAASDDGDALRAQLRNEYFRQYIDEWHAFVDGLRIQVSVGNSEVLGVLEDLTRGRPTPLERIFQVVAWNTELGGGVTEGLQQAAASLKEKLKKKLGPAGGQVIAAGANALGNGMERQFDERAVQQEFSGLVRFGVAPKAPEGQQPQPTPLDVYQEQLAFLRDALRADLENPDDHGPLISRLQTARVRVKSLVEGQEVGWRPRLESLLWSPIDALSRTSTDLVANETDGRWCSSVADPFWSRLGTRYPFRKNAPDAAIADVAEFYRPGTGRLDGFYEAVLKENVHRVGDRFQFSKRLGNVASKMYRPELLSFLRSSRQVTDALFPPGGTEPTAQFSIRIRPAPRVAATTLVIDGQTVEYRNGPEQWHTFKWPGPVKGGGAVLRVRASRGVSEAIEREGEWALFRLLEAAAIRSERDDRSFTATWKIQSLDTDLTIDFRPARAENPFLGSGSRVLDPFRNPSVLAPRNIGQGGVGCGG